MVITLNIYCDTSYTRTNRLIRSFDEYRMSDHRFQSRSNQANGAARSISEHNNNPHNSISLSATPQSLSDRLERLLLLYHEGGPDDDGRSDYGEDPEMRYFKVTEPICYGANLILINPDAILTHR